MKRAVLLLLVLVQSAYAITIVGNADDGSDLEELTPITSGIILTTRAQAVKLLQRLHVSGIEGLGALIPEVEYSKLYLVKADKTASKDFDQGNFHQGWEGKVYARTVAHPYAPTRFFPVAQNLTRDQLIALHIHEALHRSLPQEIRQDESIVSQLTLAIVSTNASRDSIAKTAASVIPDENAPKPKTNSYARTSFGYSYEQFFKTPYTGVLQITGMHTTSAYMKPFGDRFGLGLGLRTTILHTSNGPYFGPMGVIGDYDVISKADLLFRIYTDISINMNRQEIQNSPFGRDIFRIGGFLSKEFDKFFVDFDAKYSFNGSARDWSNPNSSVYVYGGTVGIEAGGGYKLNNFRFRIFGEAVICNKYEVAGGQMLGRFRLLSAGPEIGVNFGHFDLFAKSKILIYGSHDTNYSNLGDLLGYGNGDGGVSVGLKLSL